MVVGETSILAIMFQWWISWVHKKRAFTILKLHVARYKFGSMVVVACMVGNLNRFLVQSFPLGHRDVEEGPNPR